MNEPKKWSDVYPYGTKEGDEEAKFFKALARHPKYDYRSIGAIVKATGLDKKRVEEIIDKYVNKVSPPLLFPHPSNEDHWGYWERCKDRLQDDKRDISKKDKDNRIKQHMDGTPSMIGNIKIENVNDLVVTINPDGTKYWWLNGLGSQLHREDGPAIEYANGNKYWHQYGKRHRLNGPAIECANGTKEWWVNGKKHREDGPAIESHGTEAWYQNNLLHREDGPARKFRDGTKEWYQNGELHREYGPAVEYTSGSKFWYQQGKRHREDGPAVELANGDKEWWVNGKLQYKTYPPDKFLEKIKDQLKSKTIGPTAITREFLPLQE